METDKGKVIRISEGKIHQQKELILDKIQFELAEKEFVYLIGKTGTGKSSFLKALYGEVPLSGGQGTIAGFDLARLKRSDIPMLRRNLGIVFQDFQLLNDRSVYDNLYFVLKATGWKGKNQMDVKINEVLEKVDMKTKGFKMPYQLSGGEQQRVAIARALLNTPEMILADEPTGNLDPKTSVEIMNVLEDINKAGITILMATHDYALILKFPHKTIKCEGGKIFEVV